MTPITKEDKVVKRVESEEISCSFCGEKDTIGANVLGTAVRMKRDNLCFHCAFWELKCENAPQLIIEGMTYNVGKGNGGGMAGRYFEIETFAGEIIKTNDLWHGGEVPERWRERLPNNARFLGGAGAVKVGGITAFQSTRSTTKSEEPQNVIGDQSPHSN